MIHNHQYFDINHQYFDINHQYFDIDHQYSDIDHCIMYKIYSKKAYDRHISPFLVNDVAIIVTGYLWYDINLDIVAYISSCDMHRLYSDTWTIAMIKKSFEILKSNRHLISRETINKCRDMYNHCYTWEPCEWRVSSRSSFKRRLINCKNYLAFIECEINNWK
jgi:hypothetical protein